MSIRRPINRLGKNTCTFCYSGHRVYINVRRQRQLISNLVTQRLVICGATYKNNSFNIVCRKTCLVHRFSRGFYGFFNEISNDAINLLAIQINVKIHLIAILIGCTSFTFAQCDSACFIGRKFNLCSFCRPLCNSAEGFIFAVDKEIFGQCEIRSQPRNNHLIKYHSVDITTATHFNTTVSQEVDFSVNVFCNGYVKCTAAQIIYQENTFLLGCPHNAHNGCYRLLHQSYIVDACHSCSLKGCILLHLIECCRHSNDNGCFGIISYFFRQIAIQNFQNFCATFFGSKGELSCFEFDLRACSHEALEECCRIVGIVGGLVISLVSIIAVSTLININCRRGYIILFGAFPNSNGSSVVGTNCAIGSTQINAYVVSHFSILPSNTVPVLTTTSFCIMIGSIVCAT